MASQQEQPIGLEVTRTGRVLQRAFDEALTGAGGALATWLVVTALKGGDHAMQRDLASAVGIEDATLTHHLNRMERDGLVERHRDPTNRRNQLVALTADGEAVFGSLLGTVVTFDRQLRAGFSEAELATLRGLLMRLRANVTAMASTDT